MKKSILTVFVAVAIVACNTSPEPTVENKQFSSSDENKSTCTTSENKIDSVISYDFDENYKGCQTSSCAISNYNKADIIPMAEAKIGDITQCPVSGAIFEVKENSSVFTHDSQTFHTCCSGCASIFKEDPDRFAKNVSLNSTI